jgi:hypothetical protein
MGLGIADVVNVLESEFGAYPILRKRLGRVQQYHGLIEKARGL